MSLHRRVVASTICTATITAGIALAAETAKTDSDLREALTFHASFDGRLDADFATGDARLFTATAEGPGKAEPGLHTDGTTRLMAGKGLAGDALEFTQRESPWLFFRGEGNVAYSAPDSGSGWSGTVSVWLRLDPEEDLQPGYTDPIQLTTRAWNDGAFFVDFDKEGDPRDFRLGAFPDLAAWNPENKDLPEEDRPLLKVANPPFSRDEWTHVAFTWTRFNTGQATDGVAALYLNGKKQGEITGWKQTFTWKPGEEVRLYIGLYYTGLLDELSCFNRSLDAQEIARLFALRGEFGPAPQSGSRDR